MLPRKRFWEANAVLSLRDGSVRAPELAILMPITGEFYPSVTLPYLSDTVARRADAGRPAGTDPKPKERTGVARRLIPRCQRSGGRSSIISAGHRSSAARIVAPSSIARPDTNLPK